MPWADLHVAFEYAEEEQALVDRVFEVVEGVLCTTDHLRTDGACEREWTMGGRSRLAELPVE